MKRKFLTLLLTCSVVLSAVACGGNSNVTEKSDSKAPSSVKTTDKASDDVTIENQELYNQDGIVITATELDMDGSWGPSVKVLIENNSDKDVTIQTRNSSVNGFMEDISMSCDVVAGKKANDELLFTKSDFEKCGIETITDIELSFVILDGATFETIAESDMIAISTSATGNYEQSYDNSGDVLFENNGVKIVSKGYSDDSVFGPELSLYIENNSGKAIVIQPRDTSVNGFMIDGMMSADILNGKVTLDEVSFLNTDFESNGITDVETIEISFVILDAETFDTVEETGPITISF